MHLHLRVPARGEAKPEESIMRKFVSAALLAAIGIGVIALSAPPALAGTWTVKNPNTDGSFTGFLAAGPPATFTDKTTGESLACTGSSLLGVALSGTGRTVPMTISSFAYSSCTGPLDSTGTGGLSGTYSADSYDAMTGTTVGQLTGVTGNFTLSNAEGTCKVTITGTLDVVNYANSGSLISSTLDLTVTAATGSCAGLVNKGDTVTYGALYDITPVLTITSP
jgi:hypothetical protein